MATAVSRSPAARSGFVGHYYGLRAPAAGGEVSVAHDHTLQRFGVPFLETSLSWKDTSAIHLRCEARARRIFLLGMTTAGSVRAWADPRDESVRFFVGDELGTLRLTYADGSEQEFPLILGEGLWWGKLFHRFQEPFPNDPTLRSALADALKLYPATPLEDGNYVAVIVPRDQPLREITVTKSPRKQGPPVLAGITLETEEPSAPKGMVALTGGERPAAFSRFIAEKSLRERTADNRASAQKLEALRHALYSSETEFAPPPRVEIPADYVGARVSFRGDAAATVLTNAFCRNVQDIRAKVDADGMYHTSTKGARSWGGAGFGTYRDDVGMYYAASWSRDMGRSLQELTALGYLDDARRVADYCLRTSHLWEQQPPLQGVPLPPHWGRIANRPNKDIAFENDGHGMVAVFLYRLWLRLPDRQTWLRQRWPDVKAAGDWVLWQFDHPEVSGARDGVLHTTGESAATSGYSVYADAVCAEALRGLARMAASIGEKTSAAQWQQRAEAMDAAMLKAYERTDPVYGQVWTLDSAGWPNRSTVLGPLLFLADTRGFAPQDDDPMRRPLNAAAYQRLIDTYRPFGFYGQAMGYGQGFVTQAALLLDRMHDAERMIEWIAREIYDPRIGGLVVPEGVQLDPTGKYWYRTGDLGNGVQEAEIIKTLRLIIGIDDTQANRLRVYPRCPESWTAIQVDEYPMRVEEGGNGAVARIHYRLIPAGDQTALEIGADRAVGDVAVRLGPFSQQPGNAAVLIDGKLAPAEVHCSGDAWWVGCTVRVGTSTRTVRLAPPAAK